MGADINARLMLISDTVMAFLQCDIYSEALEMSTSVNVINPFAMRNIKGYKTEKICPPPVLYLLHGISDDHTMWMRRTSIERYVMGLNITVVMPAAARSFYRDMEHGYKYFTYIAYELPEIIESMFKVSPAREDTFMAGFSMGGYGAYKIALSRPERYYAAASMSAPLDSRSTYDLYKDIRDVELIFGDNGPTDQDDLTYLAKNIKGSKPKLYQCCGIEDVFYKNNLKFIEEIAGLGFDHIYEEGPGEHTWDYWDENIKKVMDWLKSINNNI